MAKGYYIGLFRSMVKLPVIQMQYGAALPHLN